MDQSFTRVHISMVFDARISIRDEELLALFHYVNSHLV
jgi:hypothetical protein